MLNWNTYLPVAQTVTGVSKQYFPRAINQAQSDRITMYSTSSTGCKKTVDGTTFTDESCKPTNLRNCAGDTGANNGALTAKSPGKNPNALFWAVYGATGGYAVQRSDYDSKFTESFPIWDPTLADVWVNAVALYKRTTASEARLYAVTGQPDIINDDGTGSPSTTTSGWNSRSVLYGSYNPYDGATASPPSVAPVYGSATQTVRWFRLYDVGLGARDGCSDAAGTGYTGCPPAQPLFYRSVFRGVAMAPQSCSGASMREVPHPPLPICLPLPPLLVFQVRRSVRSVRSRARRQRSPRRVSAATRLSCIIHI